MNRLIRAATAILMLQLTAAHSQAEETRYRGLCDASAAVALGPKHFVVADDDHHMLTIYQRGKPEAVTCVDLIKDSGECLRSGKPTKSDIEGAARIDDRIYWISSHSANSDGKFKKTRRQFFATDVLESAAGPTVSAATPPYTGLIEALVADPRFADLRLASEAGKGPEEPGGLNIEGLAATPDKELLIGFRNPLSNHRVASRRKALLVPFKNPADVLKTAAPVFGDPIALDLGGLGIRSIELVGSQFAIVAGPFGPKSRVQGFVLYTWSGKAADAPRRVKGVDFGSMHPEALFATGGKNGIYVLSDDGDDCPADKSFRGMALTLPDPDKRP
ncbi:MAG TPA: DUF3616 domain-containing protein [Azonexus sp.]|jgi:hypothetical protein|nr:DUF3616 domain-containing protein [Azonexus sp.]